MSKRKSKEVEDITKQIEDLEKKVNSRIEELENRIREWTRPDSLLWYLETFTIVISNVFVGCLIASVTAYGLQKITWAVATLMYSILFIVIRWIAGRRIQAPPRFMRGLMVLLTIFLFAGILTLVFGMIQLGWFHLN